MTGAPEHAHEQARGARRFYDRWPADLRAFALGYGVLLPLYLLPLFMTRFLPGLDLPFHQALADMLGKVDLPASPYHALYDGLLRPSPYVAHLGALHLLGRLMPINAAHKLIMGCYAASVPLSMAYLLSRSGRSLLPALLGFPLIYNMTVHYGFISFALSIPVLLMLLGLVAAVTDVTRRPLGPAFGLCAVAVLLFLCHLQNYLFGICAAAVFIAFCAAPLSRRGLAAACLLPSLGLLLWWQRTTFVGDPRQHLQQPTTDLSYVLHLLWTTRRMDAGQRPWFNLWERVQVVPDHLLRGFTDLADRKAAVGILLALLFYVVAGALAGGFGRRRGQAAGATGPAGTVEPAARMKLAGVVVLLGGIFAYLALPHHLREFELMTFYPRFAVMVVALLPLLVPAWLRRYPPRAAYLLTVPAVALSCWWGVVLARHYRDFGRETADFAAVLDQTPPGGKVLGLVYNRGSRVIANESVMVGLPSYYPVERRGVGSMVNIVYCGMRHMPCRIKDPALAPPDPGAWSPQHMNQDRALPYFDYFFTRSAPPPVSLFPGNADQMQVVARAGSWVVYGKKPGAVLKLRPQTPAPPHVPNH